MGKSFANIYLLTSSEEMMELKLPPEMFDRFIFLERLAVNEYSETFLLLEKSNENKYILKCYLKPEIENIGREAGLLHGLQIEGLPRYEAEIEYNNTLFVLREYIEGIALDQYIEYMQINKSQAVDITINLCNILYDLHTLDTPIIHRDIKPSNIIIDIQSNAVTLIDFEIARKYSEDADTDTTFFGTRKYAPPEQYGYAQTDCRTDIYALGVVLRHLLTGSVEQSAVIADRSLERIVAKCVAFSPKDRYQTVAAMKRALLRYRRRGNCKVVKTIAAVVAVCIIFIAGMIVENYIGVLPEYIKDPVAKVIHHTDLNSETSPDTSVGTPADTSTDTTAGTHADTINDTFTGTPADTPTDTLQLNPPTGMVNVDDEQKAYINEDGYIVFPDPAFEAALVDMYIDDGIGVSPEATKKITSLFISYRDITSLAGIEFFKELEYLYCYHNNITRLDVSGLPNLLYISAEHNRLTILDVSNNLRLEGLHVTDNQLTELDISNNTQLLHLNVSQNKLTELDISKNARLVSLLCYDNQLTELDVSNNPDLKLLNCQSNRLTKLDISNNPAMEDFKCEHNYMVSRDMVTGVNRSTITIFSFEPQNRT